MARQLRNATGGHIYHVLNRANARAQIFSTDKDYQLFETILEEAVERHDMRLMAYCLMPNHWHLVIHPKSDTDMPEFMRWLTNTHTKRWHAYHGTTGQGHLYQGRYKSFLCQNDYHFLTLVRYVERNAKRANLVKKAENWKWSSVWRRESGAPKQRKLLASWPVTRPGNYLQWLNEPQSKDEEAALKRSVQRGAPYGGDVWVRRVVKRLGLESTIRPRGRPRKGD